MESILTACMIPSMVTPVCKTVESLFWGLAKAAHEQGVSRSSFDKKKLFLSWSENLLFGRTFSLVFTTTHCVVHSPHFDFFFPLF